jgi:hypothetical protein
MRILADTHVHLYPCYDLALALRRLQENLVRLADSVTPRGGAVLAACLSERHDCRYFRRLCDGAWGPSELGAGVDPAADPGCLRLTFEAGPPVHLFAGRQIVSRERVEILALASDALIPDGLTACETVQRVLDAEGLPVLAWAPGKWWLRRGTIVRALLARFPPGRLLLGDSTLRPALWLEPGLMRAAAARGFGVVAGSDPLPFPGEEAYLGTYGTVLATDLDPQRPTRALREALSAASRLPARVGRRCSPAALVRRLWRHARARG